MPTAFPLGPNIPCNRGNWWQLVVRWRWEHYLIPIGTWFEATHPSQVPDPWPGLQEGSDDHQRLPEWQTWRITCTPEKTGLYALYHFAWIQGWGILYYFETFLKWQLLSNFNFCNHNCIYCLVSNGPKLLASTNLFDIFKDDLLFRPNRVRASSLEASFQKMD